LDAKHNMEKNTKLILNFEPQNYLSRSTKHWEGIVWFLQISLKNEALKYEMKCSILAKLTIK
jgi:hypothetical protein